MEKKRGEKVKKVNDFMRILTCTALCFVGVIFKQLGGYVCSLVPTLALVLSGM